MNIHDLAAMTAFYGNDDRVTRVDDGYTVRNDDGKRWIVALDDHLYWRAFDQFGETSPDRYDTPDEAIHALIGDPR